MMLILRCRRFQKMAPGVMSKYLLSIGLVTWIGLCWQGAAQAQPLPQSAVTAEQVEHCHIGSADEIAEFYALNHYVLFAQARHKTAQGKQSQVQFLVTTDMAYFYIARINLLPGNVREACLQLLAREVDYQLLAPIAGLLERKPRHHFLFFDRLPSNSRCDAENQYCASWLEWSEDSEGEYLLTAYRYSLKQKEYFEQAVRVELGDKQIGVGRGKLSAFARMQYVRRLRNELDESPLDREEAKTFYQQLLETTDHGLPLLSLRQLPQQGWDLTVINRQKGLVFTVMQGDQLELYPQSREDYRHLLGQ